MNKRLSKSVIANNASSGFVSNAWIYSRRCGCYTFLPFGSGFSSPYGWGYSVCNPFWDGYSYYPIYSWGGWGNGYSGGGRPNPSPSPGSGNRGSGRGHFPKPRESGGRQPRLRLS